MNMTWIQNSRKCSLLTFIFIYFNIDMLYMYNVNLNFPFMYKTKKVHIIFVLESFVFHLCLIHRKLHLTLSQQLFNGFKLPICFIYIFQLFSQIFHSPNMFLNRDKKRILGPSTVHTKISYTGEDDDA